MLKYVVIPKNFNIFLIKKNNILFFLIKKNNILFFFNYINLNIYLNYIYIIKKKYTIDLLNYYFFSWENYIMKKIKFKHKITWLFIFRKNLQLLKISTNYSQKIFININYFKLKRKKNYFKYHTIVLWGLDLLKINKLVCNIINLLFFNCYTHRGFKLSRMRILKRVGKISKYKSLKGKVF